MSYPQALKIGQKVRVSDSMKSFLRIKKSNCVNCSKVNSQSGVRTKNNITEARKKLANGTEPSFANCCKYRKLVKREMVKPKLIRVVVNDSSVNIDRPSVLEILNVLIQVQKDSERLAW